MFQLMASSSSADIPDASVLTSFDNSSWVLVGSSSNLFSPNVASSVMVFSFSLVVVRPCAVQWCKAGPGLEPGSG